MVLLILALSFLLILNHSALASPPRKGFSLELIHRDSIHSPLYSGNLNHTERVRRLLSLSDSRLQRMTIAGRPREAGLRPMAEDEGEGEGTYTVKVGIGNPAVNLHLFFDTGGSITWTQCVPCDPCFPQAPPIYDPAKSTTYRAVACDHPLCGRNACKDAKCKYEIRYGDDTFTNGTLAAERFTFASSHGGATETIQGLVFGCSNKTSRYMFDRSSPKAAGILALDRSPTSFATQMSDHIGGRFSYCILPAHAPGTGYLRFGDDIGADTHNMQSTPFVHDKASSLPHYYLKLNDVSIADRRLNLPAGTFDIKSDGSGGCIIDSGSAFTFLSDAAFIPVKSAIERHIARTSKMAPADARPYGTSGMCYRAPHTGGSGNYPAMTLHFEGADLRVDTANLFEAVPERGVVCFTVAPASSTLLGTNLQRNVKFVFDIRKGELKFAPEKCGEV